MGRFVKRGLAGGDQAQHPDRARARIRGDDQSRGRVGDCEDVLGGGRRVGHGLRPLHSAAPPGVHRERYPEGGPVGGRGHEGSLEPGLRACLDPEGPRPHLMAAAHRRVRRRRAHQHALRQDARAGRADPLDEEPHGGHGRDAGPDPPGVRAEARRHQHAHQATTDHPRRVSAALPQRPHRRWNEGRQDGLHLRRRHEPGVGGRVRRHPLRHASPTTSSTSDSPPSRASALPTSPSFASRSGERDGRSRLGTPRTRRPPVPAGFSDRVPGAVLRPADAHGVAAGDRGSRRVPGRRPAHHAELRHQRRVALARVDRTRPACAAAGCRPGVLRLRLPDGDDRRDHDAERRSRGASPLPPVGAFAPCRSSSSSAARVYCCSQAAPT